MRQSEVVALAQSLIRLVIWMAVPIAIGGLFGLKFPTVTTVANLVVLLGVGLLGWKVWLKISSAGFSPKAFLGGSGGGKLVFQIAIGPEAKQVTVTSSAAPGMHGTGKTYEEALGDLLMAMQANGSSVISLDMTRVHQYVREHSPASQPDVPRLSVAQVDQDEGYRVDPPGRVQAEANAAAMGNLVAHRTRRAVIRPDAKPAPPPDREVG